MKIYYRPSLTRKARELRNNSTKSEIKLWQLLKGGQMMGCDFHRQKPIGSYIVDFYCTKLKLAIEVDGYTHRFERVVKNDQKKQDYLEMMGIKVIHFGDDEVMNDISAVIHGIESAVNERLAGHTPVSPLDRGDV